MKKVQGKKKEALERAEKLKLKQQQQQQQHVDAARVRPSPLSSSSSYHGGTSPGEAPKDGSYPSMTDTRGATLTPVTTNILEGENDPDLVF